MLAHIHPSSQQFEHSIGYISSEVYFVYPALHVQTKFPLDAHHLPRAPLPAQGVTFCSAASRPRKRALPLHHRSYWLMRQTKTLLSPRFCPCVTGLCRLLRGPCWELAFPDAISADPSVDAWLPTPVGLCGALFPFLPAKHRPSPRYDKVGSHKIRTTASVRAVFRGCKHSFMFRPLPLLATLTVPTDTLFMHSSGDFYFRTYRGLLPPRVPDILAVRTGQLTAGDLHPIKSAALSAVPIT